MFLKIKISNYIRRHSVNMNKETWDALTLNQTDNTQAEVIAQAFKEADAVVVGIGAGMSASEGFT